MYRKALTALAFTASLAISGAALAKSDFTEMGMVGGWKLMAQHDASSGTFVRCSINTSQGAQRTMGLAINKAGKLEVWFTNQAWRLNPGSNYDLKFQIDSYKRWGGTFRTVNSSGGYMTVSPAEEVFRYLRMGEQLFVLTGRETLRYSLKGTARAMTALRKCWSNAGRQQFANPFGGATSGGEGTRNNIAARLANAVVGGMKGRGFKMFDHVPDNLARKNVAAIWRTPDGLGVAALLPNQISMDTARRAEANRLQSACHGRSHVEGYSRVLPGAPDTLVVKSACSRDKDGDPAFAVRAYYRLKDGKTIVITHISEDGDKAVYADEAFHGGLAKMTAS